MTAYSSPTSPTDQATPRNPVGPGPDPYASDFSHRAEGNLHEASNGSRDGSIVDVIRGLRDDSITLFRQEIALIRAEVSQKVSQAGRDAVKAAAGGVASYVGALLVIIGLCLLATYGLVEADVDPLLAAFISFTVIGLLIAITGFIVLRQGLSRLGHEDITPRHTVNSLKENAQWVKEKTS